MTGKTRAGVEFPEQKPGTVPIGDAHGPGLPGFPLRHEPEAALSPNRQLTFLTVLHDLARTRSAQLIIATHSPILLTLPGARVLSFSDEGIEEIDYRSTEHFKLSRDFLNAPERYFRHLFDDADEEA